MNGNRHRYLTLLLAVCCMAAVGITATTLETSLETDPDEVIDFEYTYLPFGEESVKEVKRERLQNQQGGSADRSESQGTSSLLDLLGQLLALLLVLVALALAYRYRERFFAAVLAGRAWLADKTPTTTGSGTVTWPSRQPANDVHRAWLAMVQRANPERPWTRTPAECARAAVDAGMDSDAVATITTHFEEVRYGDAPLTDERRRQAREWLQRLDQRGGEEP